MRARLAGILLATAAALTVSPFAALRASAETSTTTTTIDPLASSTTSTSTSTTTSTTTTTMPSAVTTVPEGCALPPEAQAVFVGQLVKTDPVTATFNVTQMRAGSLEGYSAGAVVEVRDEVTGDTWVWGQHQYIRLAPLEHVAHIVSVRAGRPGAR